MKTFDLDLEKMEVEEMTSTEIQETEGGFLGLVLQIAGVCGAAYGLGTILGKVYKALTE